MGPAQDPPHPDLDARLAAYLPGLAAFVRARTGRGLRAREMTMDLVQSACLEVLRDLPRGDCPSEGLFRHRLFLAAERKIVDRARYHGRERRDHAREASPEALATLVATGYSNLFGPSRAVSAREELERLQDALDGLEDDHREVIVLSRIVGLSHAEIAQRMGRSEEASRMLLHRALAKLASRMEG